VASAEDKLTEPAYQSSAGPIDILYGHRDYIGAGNLFMAHHCGFTEKALTRKNSPNTTPI
jgi:hypothetical protein